MQRFLRAFKNRFFESLRMDFAEDIRMTADPLDHIVKRIYLNFFGVGYSGSGVECLRVGGLGQNGTENGVLADID